MYPVYRGRHLKLLSTRRILYVCIHTRESTFVNMLIGSFSLKFAVRTTTEADGPSHSSALKNTCSSNFLLLNKTFEM